MVGLLLSFVRLNKDEFYIYTIFLYPFAKQNCDEISLHTYGVINIFQKIAHIDEMFQTLKTEHNSQPSIYGNNPETINKLLLGDEP